MKPVFADTFFFLAAINPKDRAHGAALDWSDHYQGPLVTTAWVVTELADALSERRNRDTFRQLHEALLADSRLRLIPASSALMERGLKLYLSRADKDWSLTDCISFVVMTDESLTEALTGDRHFVQAGFQALLM